MFREVRNRLVLSCFKIFSTRCVRSVLFFRMNLYFLFVRDFSILTFVSVCPIGGSEKIIPNIVPCRKKLLVRVFSYYYFFLQKLRFRVKIGFFSFLRTQIAVFIHFLEISDLLFEFVVFYFMIGHITVKFLLVPSCTSEVVSEYGPASFQCSMSYPYGRPLLLNEGH